MAFWFPNALLSLAVMKQRLYLPTYVLGISLTCTLDVSFCWILIVSTLVTVISSLKVIPWREAPNVRGFYFNEATVK